MSDILKMQPENNNSKFLAEDFGDSDDEKDSGSDEETADKNGLPKERVKKIKNLPIEKLCIVYRFLMQVTEGLSHDQIKNVH